jgi:hypothetical protein
VERIDLYGIQESQMLRKESSSVLPEKRAIDDQVHRGYLFYLQTAVTA